MNIYKIKPLLLVVAFVASLTSCQKVLDINTDPNNLTTATPELVLPSGQVMLASAVGNQWNFIGSMWAQYWTGGYGVSSSQLEFYNMINSDNNLAWTTAYARSLKDLSYLINSGQPRFSGAAKIMSAYMYQMLTDLHGDIPFNDALKGEATDGGIVAPNYDSEATVYAALIPLIDEGVADLEASGASVREMGAADLFYSGDVAKWKKLANTLKLKVLVRSGQYAAAKSLMDSGAEFIGNGEDFKMSYFETGKNTNPIYARFIARTDVGMYYVAAWSSVQKLIELSDPRINKIYISGTAGDSGVYSGDINVNTTAYPAGGNNTRFARPNTTYVFSATTPVFLLSAWESKFLQAEVLIRTGGDASTLFEEAVQASFNYYGAGSASAYVSSLDFGSASVDGQLNILAVQKWISMNGLQMAEGWLETARFDRPGNRIFTEGIFTSPETNSLGEGNFPSSFVYPTSETNYNPNVPKDREVTDKRSWDN